MASRRRRSTTALDTVDYPRPLTWADWRRMEESIKKIELWFGKVIAAPSPTWLHQRAIGELLFKIHPVARTVPGAELVLGVIDVKLRDDLVLQPDLVVWTGKAGGLRTEGWFEGPVDLVIEVLSAAEGDTDLVQKASIYANAGVPEYWVVDADRGKMIVHRLVDGVYRRELAGDRVACAALDGLEIDLTWLPSFARDEALPD
jgi:Uma2 family endonuclease